jgi:hypothetical protein
MWKDFSSTESVPIFVKMANEKSHSRGRHSIWEGVPKDETYRRGCQRPSELVFAPIKDKADLMIERVIKFGR